MDGPAAGPAGAVPYGRDGAFDIRVEDGVIVAVGPDLAPAKPFETLDARGTLNRGAQADLAICDIGGGVAAGGWDPVALLLAGRGTVRDLLVQGRRIVADGGIATLDLAPVLPRQRALSAQLMT